MKLRRKIFVHTHVHSDFSVLDSIARIPDLVARAKEYNMPGLAITDHGSLSGSWRFYNACREGGINPIIGYEAYVYNRKKFLNAKDKRKIRPHHLILIAKNFEGFRTLLKLHGEAVRNAFLRRPLLYDNLILENSKNLICTTACIGSRFSKLLIAKKLTKAHDWFKKYKEAFGKDFYLELLFNNLEDQKIVNEGLIHFSKKLNIKKICTADVHFLDKDDFEIQTFALLIQQKKTMAELIAYKQRLESGENPRDIKSKDRVFHFSHIDLSLKSYVEMVRSAKDSGIEEDVVCDCLRNTLEINEKSEIEFPKDVYHFPEFSKEANPMLDRLTHKRFEKTFMVHKKNYVDRLNHELEVIEKKGFANYMLIIWDLCKFARKQGIFMSPGRGSVAGSLVAYVLQITNIDPIEHSLYFERFLNPSRSEPPDIDLDFESERRDEIENYLIDKYGKDRVSKIANFSTFAGKSVIRDLGRVMGKSLKIINQITKSFKDKTWEIINYEDEIKRVENEDPVARNFFSNNKTFRRACIKLHEVVRHLGVHPAGIVIAPDSVENFVPIMKVHDRYVIALREGGDAREVSEAGVLKIDILGLDNCSTVQKTLNILRETRNINLEKQIMQLDLDDSKVIKKFARGDTMGIFQFESDSITNLLKKIKPETFEDIAMINAVHRPATLQSGIASALSSEGLSLIKHPKVEKLLSDTRGHIVFQEQVMALLNQVAGFSLEEADEARRVMKKSSRLKEMPKSYKKIIKKFENGCKKHTPDLDEDNRKLLLKYLTSFNEYSFNKSHAVSYSYLAMQTMYLKTYYFLEYMTAILSITDNVETGFGRLKKNKLERLIRYVKSKDVEILPIRIGKSKENFAIENGKIRMGYSVLKGIGDGSAKMLEEKFGPELDPDDFFDPGSFDGRALNKRVVEALVKIGAFSDTFEGYNDREIFNAYLKWNHAKRKEFITDYFEQTKDFQLDEKIAFEKKFLGFYFKVHPLDRYSELLKDDRLTTLAEVKKSGAGVVPVKIEKVTLYESPAAGKMAFLDISDTTDRADVVVWSSILDANHQYLKMGELVILKLKKSKRGGFEIDQKYSVVKLADIQK